MASSLIDDFGGEDSDIEIEDNGVRPKLTAADVQASPSSSDLAIPSEAIQVVSLRKTFAFDLKVDSTILNFLKWKFDVGGASIKRLGSKAPACLNLQVGDRLVSLNSIPLLNRSLRDIMQVWNEQLRLTHLVRLVFESVGTHTICYVVDCGSRETRVIRCSMDEEGVGLRSIFVDTVGALSDVLPDPAKHGRFIEELLSKVPEKDKDTHLLIAATGGVRELLDCGTLNKCVIDNFRNEIREQSGGETLFQVLTESEEALWEWAAAKEAVGTAVRRDLLEPQDCAGMLSGGGATSQLVAVACDDTGDIRDYCFECCVKKPAGLMRKAATDWLDAEDIDAGLLVLHTEITAKIDPLPKGLPGIFVLIEWPASYIVDDIGKDYDFPFDYERILKHEKVLHALTTVRPSIRTQLELNVHGTGTLKERLLVQKKLVEVLVYGTLMEILLRAVFRCDSQFVCLGRGRSFVPNWMTGYAVQRQIKAADARSA